MKTPAYSFADVKPHHGRALCRVTLSLQDLPPCFHPLPGCLALVDAELRQLLQLSTAISSEAHKLELEFERQHADLLKYPPEVKVAIFSFNAQATGLPSSPTRRDFFPSAEQLDKLVKVLGIAHGGAPLQDELRCTVAQVLPSPVDVACLSFQEARGAALYSDSMVKLTANRPGLELHGTMLDRFIELARPLGLKLAYLLERLPSADKATLSFRPHPIPVNGAKTWSFVHLDAEEYAELVKTASLDGSTDAVALYHHLRAARELAAH